MKDTTKVYDEQEREIKVGTTVCVYGEPTEEGTVVRITDFDGDVDDDTGRSIVIEPTVIVRWQDGAESEFATTGWDYDYDYELDPEDGQPVPTAVHSTGTCPDLEVRGGQ